MSQSTARKPHAQEKEADAQTRDALCAPPLMHKVTVDMFENEQKAYQQLSGLIGVKPH
jgi:hypothetical protein